MKIDGEAMVMEATTGFATVGSRWPLPEPFAARVGQGEFIVSAESSEVEAELPEENRAISALYSHSVIAPMHLAGELLGTLVVARRMGRTAFGEEDLSALRHFAALAALIVGNARLLQRVRDEERNKSDFIDVAVHELRSPLTVISGYAEMLGNDLREQLSPQAADFVERISRKASEALALANSLLDVARLESREVRITMGALDVGRLIDGVAERAEAAAALRRSSIAVERPATLNVYGDRDLVDRILDNLVGNAIAYAGEAAVVEITTETDGTDVVILIRDSGPGIPAEDTERIFERFVRGAGHDVRGTGLGLYVSRELARRMDGDVSLADTGPDGSVFQLRLRRAG